MDLHKSQFVIPDEGKRFHKVQIAGKLDGDQSDVLRKVIAETLAMPKDGMYLDLVEVSEIEISGINEIINTHYTMKQIEKTLVVVYRAESEVAKAIDISGIQRFVKTAIVPA